MVRLKGAYCQVKVSYGYRNGKGGKVVHNAETSKARLGLWSFLTKWDSFGDKSAILWIVSWTTLSKHLQASNGYVQSPTCSNGYNGLSTAMDFTSDYRYTIIRRGTHLENKDIRETYGKNMFDEKTREKSGKSEIVFVDVWENVDIRYFFPYFVKG